MKKPLQEMLIKLKSVFPDAVTETQRTDEDGNPFYVYALKEEFIEQLQDNELDIADDQNRYELQFPGKSAAKAQAFVPSYKTLVADKKQSKNFDETGNVFIEGDNLDALRMLQKSYRGKIKVIYIDPPYNTGSDDFVYNDDFSVRQRAYLEATGVLDEEGIKQISEIQNGLRGRFHAGWLVMMYPRLKLARELLSDDGVIFISIDDNEHANLKLICDEIFGEEGFRGAIKRRAARKTAHLSKDMSDICDYVLVYTKHILSHPLSIDVTQDNTRPVIQHNNKLSTRILRAGTPAKCDDGIIKRGKYTLKSTVIEFLNDAQIASGRLCNDTLISANFRVSQDLLDQTVYITKNHSLRRKLLESEKGRPKIMTDIWDDPSFYNEKGTEELEAIFEVSNTFNNPKPTGLIKTVCRSCTNPDDDSYVLDFFCGSATTAHAVLQLNAEDGGNRKFIMMQWAEKIDSQKSKDAYKFCAEKLNRPATIAEVAKERIRRAGDKIRTDNPDKQIDDGFRVYTVQDSLLTDSSSEKFTAMGQPALSGLKTDLAVEKFEPLLYEAILETGVTLDLPITKRKIDEYPFAVCHRRCYCVTEGLTQTIVRKIVEQFGDEFDTFYYLSDCPTAATSYTELKAAIQLAPDNKERKIKILSFY